MKLSRRLQAIENMIDGPCVLADIGCDHALLPISVVQNGKCERVYACDVHEGPLERAKEAIYSHQMETHVFPILCDGLHALGNDVTTIVIAGMGFDTIKSILEKDMDKLASYQQVIIQSNNHVDELRTWISKHNFIIDKEEIVHEHHYYQIISMHKGIQTMLSNEEIIFGKNLEVHPIFRQFWLFQLAKQEKILLNMKEHHASYDRVKSLIKRIQLKLELIVKDD